MEVDLRWICYFVCAHHLERLVPVLTLFRSEHDQDLDTLLVGPIPVGVNKFIFDADPPDTSKIPDAEILGVTVILLTCSYDNREFVRVGYYVNNEYDSDELNADPPPKPIFEKVRRNILAEKPRVTRFAIKWLALVPNLLFISNVCRDSDESAPAEFPPDQPEADLVADEDEYGAEEVEEEEEAGEGAEGAGAVDPDAMVEDSEMAGAEGDAAAAAEESDDGSEDLEAESSGSEDEELEEEPGEGDVDEAMELDGAEKPHQNGEQHADAVMAH
jgi:histone chaperone ASF1